jgi:hypothetical protein
MLRLVRVWIEQAIIRQAAKAADADRRWRELHGPVTVEISNELIDAYRRGARMTEWEVCIDHDADRTIAGLREAFTAAGFKVVRP